MNSGVVKRRFLSLKSRLRANQKTLSINIVNNFLLAVLILFDIFD